MAARLRPSVRLVVLAAGAVLLLSPTRDAAARKFQMSGTWIWRTGHVFLPLQFAAFGMDMTGNFLNLSMGNLSGAFGTPNGPIPGEGGVTATGSAPATLRIPRHRFVEDAMALVPLNGVSLVQITTNLGIDGPYAGATLAPGGGPGSFTWCPGDPACAAGGGMRSTDPPQGADLFRNGRVIYHAGASRFGGAMQLGLRRGADTARIFDFDSDPLRVRIGHFPGLGVGSTLRSRAVGGLGSADVPAKQTVFLPRGFVTQPTMPKPSPPCCTWVLYPGPILHPGPKLTTMFGTTQTGSGPVFYLPQIATGPMGTRAGRYTTHYGFANTTGTVIAQQTTGSSGQDFFTVMGSDARTPLGAGNLSLVAGGLSVRHTPAETAPYASFQKLTLTLASPIPSLSPAGFVAAAALVLLAAGYAFRRRLDQAGPTPGGAAARSQVTSRG